MTRNRQRLVWLGIPMLGAFIVCPASLGQTIPAAEKEIPSPIDPVLTDWSHHHVIFSRPGTAEQAARLEKDPRYLQQRYRNEVPPMAPMVEPRDDIALELPIGSHSSPAVNSKKLNGDWQENLGSGASVGAANYPAKYSFKATTAFCGGATQPDFVVYYTGLAGASNQATVVAYDNLYSGCTGTVPSTYWAYNTGTGAQVLTSPAFSRDGKQVTFVQTDGGFGFLVLLKWAASTTESVSSPRTLTAVGNGAYRGCTAPCMTTIALKDGNGVETDDTTSSIFADISDDIGWVGGANGWLHKITGIFLGTPAEVTGGPFPLQVNPGNVTVLSDPVHDYVSGNVFVGDGGGFLYRVDANSAAVTISGQIDFGVGIVQGPILDPSHGLVYVFASSDGSASCNGGADCTGVFQLSTSFVSGDTGSEVEVGNSTVFGTATPNPLYIGAFDNAYENSTDATGDLYVCGNTGGPPTLYQVKILAGALPVNGSSISGLTPAADSPPCSPVTDVYTPNPSGGATEQLFVSVQGHGEASSCGGAGCIMNFLDSPWQANTAYTVGQEIFSSRLHIEVAVTAGTSGATMPTWTNSAGAFKNDGGVRWLDQGVLLATQPAWVASHNYTANTDRILDGNGNIEVSTTHGISGSTTPVWNTTPGGTTADGPVIWTNAGSTGTFALSAAGGTSGIIIDNTVGTLAGASQVYFSTLSDQSCATSGTTGGCAVQASQSALQ
jgi:hypothetical protein